MRDDRERLRDILEATERIQRYACLGRTRFDADELIQTWVVHHIQIIGEACRGLSERFKQQNADWPWRQIVGMRNILVHQYFGIDRDAVWAVVEHDLQDLVAKAQAALAGS